MCNTELYICKFDYASFLGVFFLAHLIREFYEKMSYRLLITSTITDKLLFSTILFQFREYIIVVIAIICGSVT